MNFSAEQKHLFAFFYSDLSALCTKRAVPFLLKLSDKDYVLRLSKIVRLQEGERVVFFNSSHAALCEIISFSKQYVEISVLSYSDVQLQKPCFILGVSILKKEAFESVIYSATQLGVSRIVPLITQKIHKQWITQKDYERFERIAIAAAEQSKQFSLPLIEKPMLFDEYREEKQDAKTSYLFFESDGMLLKKYTEDVFSKKPDTLSIIVGPEGGLSSKEQVLLKENGWRAVSLTSPILRAHEAVLVGIGSLRSLLR